MRSAINAPNRDNFAGEFRATGAGEVNYGVSGLAVGSNFTGASIGVLGTGNAAVSENYGVVGIAESANSALNIGGSFDATGGDNAYGIFAEANGANNNNFAGYFNGVVVATAFNPLPSDQNLKSNIVNFDSALYYINELDPKTFVYDNSIAPQMNLSTGHQYGFIAQDVETAIPSLVKTITHPAVLDSNGVIIHPAYDYKALNYEQIIPILVGGVKEQQLSIDSLKNQLNVQDSINTDLQTQINQLYSMMMACCESNQAMQLNGTGGSDDNGFSNSINVELNETQSIVLEQNVPNPFAEQTTINFSLPTSVEKAQMLFYNIEGKLIKSIDINERGASRINVFASDLSNGIYTYTLVADGEIVDTKRMVKQ